MVNRTQRIFIIRLCFHSRRRRVPGSFMLVGDTRGFETSPLVLPLLLHAHELVMTRFLSGELWKYFLFLMYLRSVCR